MPTERLRGTTVEQAETYAGVPDAEHYVLLDRNQRLTPGFRRAHDPEYQEADATDEVPTLIFERGEELPEWAVTAAVWNGSRIAALDVDGQRVDTPGPAENTEQIDAPATLREWRAEQGLQTVRVWACQVEGCDETFDTQQGLAAHARSHRSDEDEADAGEDATGATDDEDADATGATDATGSRETEGSR